MEYWEKRFLDGGKIWGDKPSRTANYALELFKRHDVNKILVPALVMDGIQNYLQMLI